MCMCTGVERCHTSCYFLIFLLLVCCELMVLHTHIDQARVVSFSQVVQHRGFVEAGEVGHVLHFTEARGIHPLHLLPGQGDSPLAVCQLHFNLIASLLPNAGRLEAEGGRSFTKMVRMRDFEFRQSRLQTWLIVNQSVPSCHTEMPNKQCIWVNPSQNNKSINKKSPFEN